MRIEMQDIAFSYLGRRILENVNIHVNDHETLVILGASGAGKTTILQIAAGLLTPDKGEIKKSFRQQAIVFQEPRLLPWKTTYENIAYGLMNSHRPSRTRDFISDCAKKVGLKITDLEKYPAALSGGMRQRAAVARALAVNPDIIFFDEPFSAVDIGLRRNLQDIVIEEAKGQGFSSLFVTHDLHEALRIAHRLLLVGGDPATIVAERHVEGEPGKRSEREIFDMSEEFAKDRDFYDLLYRDRD